MSHIKEMWRGYVWHCPVCGKISTGFQDETGTVRAECPYCHTVMVRRFMGRRHERMEIYHSQELVCMGADDWGGQASGYEY